MEGLTRVPLGEAARAGDYRVVLTPGASVARVAIEDAQQAPTLRLAEYEFIETDPQTSSSGSLSWSFELDRVPLLVGIGATVPEVGTGIEVQLTGPAGPLIQAGIQPDVPWIGGANFGFIAPPNAAGVLAGAYEATVTFEPNAGTWQPHAFHFMLFLT